MKHHRSQHAAKLACPSFWALFCEHFLGADVRLAKELWRQLYPSEAQPLMYQLARLEDSDRHPDSTRRFGALANPELLMRVCERLSPSRSGEPRRRDVLLLEEKILSLTTSEGRWM